MKTKVDKKVIPVDVQTHIDPIIGKFCTFYELDIEEATNVVKLFDKHLKTRYAPVVVQNLSELGVEKSASAVRQVRIGGYKDDAIFTELLSEANSRKNKAVAARKKMKQLIST